MNVDTAYIIQPGKAGTIDSRDLVVFRMGDGANKYTRVILDGRIMLYVGIGWIDEREAKPEDAEAFPVVTFPVPTVSHQARF